MKKLIMTLALLSTLFFYSGCKACDVAKWAMEQNLPEDEKICAQGERLREKMELMGPQSQVASYQLLIQKKLLEEKWNCRVLITERPDDDALDIHIFWLTGNEASTLSDLLCSAGRAAALGADWGDCDKGGPGGMALPGWPDGRVLVVFQRQQFAAEMESLIDRGWEDVEDVWIGVDDFLLERQMTEL